MKDSFDSVRPSAALGRSAKPSGERIIRYAACEDLLLRVLVLALGRLSFGDDSERLLTIDHYVRVKSTVPALAGQDVPIYVRERVQAGTALRSASTADRVALFVHGAGTPAEVAFDVPQPRLQLDGVSGARRLRRVRDGHHRLRPIDPAGGDERSLQPRAAIARRAFVPSLIPRPCAPSYPHAMTTIASDWNDIGAVVDYVRALRRVDKVSLLAWSLGGPRAGGYAAQHPEKVHKLVLLAPAYNRDAAGGAAGEDPPDGTAMNTQSREEFSANWDRQVGCPAQYEPAVGRRRLVARCSRPIRSARRGARACGARRRRRPGAGTRRHGGEDAGADADGRRTARQAGAARSRARALRRSRRRRRSCSSIWPARRTMRCGRRTACCCSARRSSG